MFTKSEAASLLSVVEVLKKHDRLPSRFASHIESAVAKLATPDPSLDAADAAGLCAATHEYLKATKSGSMPSQLRDIFASVWKKLIEVQRDKPVFFVDNDGWKICVNGTIEHGPFESEDRARFFWSIRSCPLNS